MTKYASVVLFCASAAALAAQTRAPQTHRLEATPATVAVGYYWSEAKPVLRIASGDIIDVDTLLTNNPTGLVRAGVADDKIQASLKAITAEVTGDRRGPGGHILTGPVYVEGAQPGDALEVKVLSIDLPQSMRATKLPVLVLQGENDFEVRKDLDFDALRASVGIAEGRIEYRSFPDLNHYFIKVGGMSTGSEYGREGELDPAVIDAISRWIFSH